MAVRIYFLWQKSDILPSLDGYFVRQCAVDNSSADMIMLSDISRSLFVL